MIAVLCLVGLHLAVILPPIRDSYHSDDTILLVALVMEQWDGRSPGQALAYLFAADQSALPRGLWKLYVLLGSRLFGPSNAGLVYLGVALHLATSGLVVALARRLGWSLAVAWVAGGLHATAYAGFHAYLWPVGVQHVLTILGALALLVAYLVAEQRRREGRPFHVWYGLALAVAVISSLGRATSLVGPAAIVTHVLLAPGAGGARLRRFDTWCPLVPLSLVYPIGLLVSGADDQALRASPVLAAALMALTEFLGTVSTAALLIAVVVGALALIRLLLASLARLSPGPALRLRPRTRRWLQVTAGLVALPGLAPILVVCASGVAMFVNPLGLALNSANTARWHAVTAPLDLMAAGLGAAVIFAVLRRHRGNPDLLILLVPLAAFALALRSSAAQPMRYWAYATPALSILLAAGGAALVDAGTSPLAPRGAWRGTLVVPMAAILMLLNTAAVRLETWRHHLADTFQVFQYARAAELVRTDLAASGLPRDTPLCVEGLAPPPYDRAWQAAFGYRGEFRDYAARAVFAQALRRPDPSGILLDCRAGPAAGLRRYTIREAAIRRGDVSIDPFDAFDTHLRHLLASGHHEAARAALTGSTPPRPFLLRYVLGTLPDRDIPWLTNGASLGGWLAEIAENYDHWYGTADPTVALIRDLMAREARAYLRLLFLVEFVNDGVSGPAPGPASAFSENFTGDEVRAILGSDPLIASSPEMRPLLDQIAAGLMYSPDPRLRDTSRRVTGLAFFAFLTRLLRGSMPGVP